MRPIADGLRGLGFVVWLRADPPSWPAGWSPTGADWPTRPPLTPAGTLAEIATVLEVRIPLYQELADAVIETGDKTPDEVADAILDAAGLA